MYTYSNIHIEPHILKNFQKIKIKNWIEFKKIQVKGKKIIFSNQKFKRFLNNMIKEIKKYIVNSYLLYIVIMKYGF